MSTSRLVQGWMDFYPWYELLIAQSSKLQLSEATKELGYRLPHTKYDQKRKMESRLSHEISKYIIILLPLYI